MAPAGSMAFTILELETCCHGLKIESNYRDAHLKDGSDSNTKSFYHCLRAEPKLSNPVLKCTQVA